MTQIKTGDIFHMKDFVENTPYRDTKYVVVVCDNENWCFTINTENRKYFKALSIKKENHSFLKNDEHYIACHTFIKFKEEKITNRYGSLRLDELEMLLAHLSSKFIRNIKPLDKLKIISSIKKRIEGK